MPDWLMIPVDCVGIAACYLGWRRDRNPGMLAGAAIFLMFLAGRVYQLSGGTSEAVRTAIALSALLAALSSVGLMLRNRSKRS